MDSRSHFVSLLADAASAELAIPLPCPMEIADGRYLLQDLIDSGHRAWVYRAVDRRLSSQNFEAAVIVKVFKSTRSDEQESLLARRAEHPNIVGVIDRGRTADGHPFLVMEYARGGDLARLDVPIDPAQAADLVARVADAVQCMHASGIVHCDIKPANILLSDSQEPLLADFELAASPLTDSVSFRGTLAFMSPEQQRADDNALGPLTDVYGLGAVLHWLLVGQTPHAGGQAATTRPGAVPSALMAICQRAVEYERHKRHPSAAALAGDLRQWLANLPIEWQNPTALDRTRLWFKRHPGRAAVLTALVLGIISASAIGLVWQRQSAKREIEAKARSLELANIKIEELQAAGRRQIEAMFNILGLKTRSASEDMLPVIVWLDWLGTSSLVSNDGRVLAPEERLRLLQDLLVMTDQERPRSVESLVLRTAIAELQMRDRRSEQALKTVLDARLQWADRLEPNDPIRNTLRAIEVCAQFDAGLISGPDARRDLESSLTLPGLRDRLRDAIERRLDRLKS